MSYGLPEDRCGGLEQQTIPVIGAAGSSTAGRRSLLPVCLRGTAQGTGRIPAVRHPPDAREGEGTWPRFE